MRRLLLSCDVAMLITHFEGLPLVLWEAMAVATPVIATAVDGVPEAITDGENGQRGGDLVRRLVPHQQGRPCSPTRPAPRRLGRAGLKRVRRSFCPRHFGASMAPIYRGIDA